MTRSVNIPSSQRGVAAIEFALVLIPMLTLCFGITELGRAIYYYDTLVKSARAGVRHLTISPPGDATAWSEAKCLAVYGATTCGGTPLAPGLTTAMVDIRDAISDPATHRNVATGSGVVDMVTVTVGTAANPYLFQSAVGWVIPNLTFAPVHATMTQLTS
jgi:Flp pilus assembly protein TadG